MCLIVCILTNSTLFKCRYVILISKNYISIGITDKLRLKIFWLYIYKLRIKEILMPLYLNVMCRRDGMSTELIFFFGYHFRTF